MTFVAIGALRVKIFSIKTSKVISNVFDYISKVVVIITFLQVL